MRYLREDILWFIRNDLLSDALPAVVQPDFSPSKLE